MSFLGFNLDDAQEPTAVPAGEYQVRIAGLPEKKTTQKGTDYLSMRLEVVDGPMNAKDMNFALWFPNKDDDAKQKNNTLWRMKEFCLAFGFDPAGDLSFEEMVGAQAWAFVEYGEDEKYGPQNSIKRWIKSR